MERAGGDEKDISITMGRARKSFWWVKMLSGSGEGYFRGGFEVVRMDIQALQDTLQ